ncbi:MAG TPA: lytic transglycosylase domain-containing protein [Blastocatellia bacterium]|jgi:soluble lytic murein transglycosylase|nr:lytic transglycosylase domain-containing protein [Blastocatellia bacterium]
MVRKGLTILILMTLLSAAGTFGAWYYWTHRYDDLIVKTAGKYGLDPALVKSIIYEESFFNPRARSSQNAVGLMQVTPIAMQEWLEQTRVRSLSEALGSISGYKPGGPEPAFEEAFIDPAVSLNVGCWYLQRMLNRYRDEPDPIAVALAAYNAGPANVERWASNAERSGMSREEFIARIEFPVTRTYVQKIIARYQYYKKDRDLR